MKEKYAVCYECKTYTAERNENSFRKKHDRHPVVFLTEDELPSGWSRE